MAGNCEEYIRSRIEKQTDNQHWFSLDIPDNQFQLRAILDFLGDVHGKAILDIGCAKGRFIKQFVKRGACATGIDLSSSLVESARENVPQARILQGSATDLPFNDDEFDAVYSVETFEHIPDTRKAIEEACRVLKPGGKIVIIDKRFWSLHPDMLIPTPLWKFALEKAGKWVYEAEGPFKERYFSKGQLDAILAKYCSEKHTISLPEFGIGPRTIELMRKHPSLVKTKLAVAKGVFMLFPGLSFRIAWRWVK